MNWIRIAGMFLGFSALFGGSALFSRPADDPLTRPIAPERAKRWLGPQVPLRIYGNSYLVGFSGLNVGLIKTDAGLILIDAGVPQGVAVVEANLRKLGFRVQDVKLILSTEPHFDHAGGLAALARDSNATVVASDWAAQALRAGRSPADDPQAADLEAFPGVRRLRVVQGGEVIRLGGTTVTARATPGHTPGSMSWSWRSCEAGKCLNMVFGSSLNPIAAEGWRFIDPAHAGTVAAFRSTFAAVRALPCDVLLTAHPEQSGGDVKLAQFRKAPRPNPFVDPDACRAYADRAEAALDKKLGDERATSK